MDVQAHLSDALPAVVRPVLQDLRSRTDADAEALTIDELRYLVHACTRLPSPGIKVEEVELLATHTHRLIGSANFAKAAHLVVSWLQIRAPAKAKQHYLDVVGVICTRLSGERPTHPAHPVLIAGLSPALATLLAREGHRDPPPITPPFVRDIVAALMQISRGLLSQVETRPPKGDALNFVDWVGIAHLAAEFCDEHGRDTNPDASRSLPGWAAETLGFAVLRAHRPLATKAVPDLDSMLTILRLLRRYKVNPAPDRQFFVWVAKQLEMHHQTASDSVTLAEIVGELVPRLPPAERGRFALKLFAKAQPAPPSGSASKTFDAAIVQEPPTSTRRLLDDTGITRTAGVALVTPLSRHASLSRTRTSKASSAPHNMLEVYAKPTDSRNRLWGTLSPAITFNEVDSAPKSTAVQVEGEAAVHHFETDNALEELAVGAESTDDQRQELSSDTVSSQASVKELSLRLEAALQRVEALEAKLGEQSSGLRDDVENLRGRVVAVEKADATPKEQPRLAEAAVMPKFPSTMPELPNLHSFFPEREVVPYDRLHAQPPIPSKSTLHLRRPFNFEELRRAQSQNLQNERLRVLVPSDPQMPFPKKW